MRSLASGRKYESAARGGFVGRVSARGHHQAKTTLACHRFSALLSAERQQGLHPRKHLEYS